MVCGAGMRKLLTLLFVLLCIGAVFAFVNGNVAVVRPLNNTYANGTLVLNITFPGNVNITLQYNTTGTATPLNTTNNVTSPFVISINTTNGSYADGVYTFRINVTNITNLTDRQIVIISNITIDNTRPAVFNFTVNQTSSHNNSNVTLRVNVTDANGISSVLVGVTSYQSMTLASNGSANTWELIVTPAQLGCVFETNHCALRVNATDRAGNANTSVTITFQSLAIDMTPPNVTLNQPANNTNWTSSTVHFGFANNDQWLSSNSTLFINGTLNQTLVGSVGPNVTLQADLADGDYSWYIYNVDSGGNANTSRTYYFTVDATAPQIAGIGLNFSGARKPTAGIRINFTLTEAHILSVNISNATSLAMSHMGNNVWQINTTPSALGCAANGDCRINMDARDTFGNRNITLATTVTVDNRSPTILSVMNTSITSSGAFINWTSSESANGNISYGTTLDLGTNVSATVDVLTYSLTLSGLSASTPYYYNVTICDTADNCNTTGSYNFTTAAAEVAASSSGGGRRGSAAPALIISEKPVIRTLTANSNTLFRLPTQTTSHQVSVTSLDGESAVLTFRSDPVSITVKEGDDRTVDIDGDGTPDVRVVVLKLTISYIRFTLEQYSEPAPVVVEPELPVIEEPIAQPVAPVVEPETPVVQQPAQVEEANHWWILGVIIAIVGVLGYMYSAQIVKMERVLKKDAQKVEKEIVKAEHVVEKEIVEVEHAVEKEIEHVEHEVKEEVVKIEHAIVEEITDAVAPAEHHQHHEHKPAEEHK